MADITKKITGSGAHYFTTEAASQNYILNFEGHVHPVLGSFQIETTGAATVKIYFKVKNDAGLSFVQIDATEHSVVATGASAKIIQIFPFSAELCEIAVTGNAAAVKIGCSFTM